MFFNKIKSLTAALLICSTAPAIACTETEAFGFRFGDTVPAGASTDLGIFGYSGGSVLGQYRVEVPDPFPDFPIYAAGAITTRRVVYEVIAIRRISPESLMNTPQDDPERKRVKDAARLEVSALLKHYSEKYGFVYRKDGYPNHFQFEATTPTLVSRIGVGGIQSIYIECRHRELHDREYEAAKKERGGSIWGTI